MRLLKEPGVGGSRSELGYPAPESEPLRRRVGGRSRVTAPGGLSRSSDALYAFCSSRSISPLVTA